MASIIQLRPYQQILIDKVRNAYQNGRRAPLAVAPCGAGKTIVFSYLTQAAVAKTKRVLILTHRIELIDQISETLGMFNVPHGLIHPGSHYDASLLAHVGSVLSVAKKEIAPPDLIVADECHHVIRCSSWGKIFERFPRSYKLGVTATPTRLSGEPLDLFDEMILGPTVQELISLGSLSPYRIFAPSRPDLSKVHSRGGDYVREELLSIVDKPSITGSAILEYERLALRKKAIVFCISVEHAQKVAAQFESRGHPAAAIYGAMDKNLRKQLVQDFRDGRVMVLTSVDLVGEGFNLPSVECAIMLRPTQSLTVWVQQSGRALRPHPGKKEAIILDHAGNCQRHGLPNETHEWSLSGKLKRPKKNEDSPTVRVCPTCYFAQPVADACINCGMVFPIKQRSIKEIDGELTEIQEAQLRRQNRRDQGSAQSMNDLIALGKKRGYKNPAGWARYVYAARQSKRSGRT